MVLPIEVLIQKKTYLDIFLAVAEMTSSYIQAEMKIAYGLRITGANTVQILKFPFSPIAIKISDFLDVCPFIGSAGQ